MSLLCLLVSALGDVIPRMPLMEWDEPAASMLTDDTCISEPVDAFPGRGVTAEGAAGSRLGGCVPRLRAARGGGIPDRVGSARAQSPPVQGLQKAEGWRTERGDLRPCVSQC